MEDDDIVAAFLVESAEGLDELDQDLVALERDPGARERLASIFRTIHTIKGTSGFLAFGQLEKLAHAGESLLSLLRDGAMTMTPPVAEVLLAMVDQLRVLLDVVAQSGSDGEGSPELRDVIAALHAAAAGDTPVFTDGADVAATADVVTAAAAAAEAPNYQAGPGAHAAPAQVSDAVSPHAPTISPSPLQAPPAAAAIAADPALDDRSSMPSATPSSASAVADASVRVDVELLDTLVRLVGELVLTRNQIVQQAAGDPELARTAQRLNVVASELQESVMLTRMQPIGQAWTKFPRIVRDLATQLAKDVRLDTFGQETELDRSLLEAIKDPLTHLVRNAIDHGMETPAARVVAGKPAQGVLSLRAHHESGQVVVEVADDGPGLDPTRIGAVAVARGVVGAADVARMSERELIELIFRPGFSTAAAVTNVSGRGVGMDVVRTNIERIGGVVDVSSRVGHGTTFRVRIPLTLAIIPALVVSQGGNRYAIPQASLVELVRYDQVAGRDVETVAGAQLLRLRDQLLPLVTLEDALRPPPAGEVQYSAGRTSYAPPAEATVVVVQADSIRFGLVVDEVHDTQEIVVKPLGRQLKQVPLYAGATIMGEGQVALILNISGVADALAITPVPVGRATEMSEAEDSAARPVALLVLDLGGGHRAAMPLADVSRLEEVSSDIVERSGTAEAVQYRDGILPLIRLADRLGVAVADGAPLRTSEAASAGIAAPTSFPVVVHGEGANRVGLVAERILDLVETVVVPSRVGAREGVLGTAVVQDRLTDLIDVDAIVHAAINTQPRRTRSEISDIADIAGIAAVAS